MYISVTSTLTALCLFFNVHPSSAQSVPTTREGTSSQLPIALSQLIKTAYICQGVVGKEVLAQAKGLAHDELIKLGLDEFNTSLLVTTSESAAEQICDDADNCWQLLPGLNARSTETEGQAACNEKLSNEIRLIQELNRDYFNSQSR